MATYDYEQVKSGLADNSIVLIDVRKADERKKERIPGSVHLPVDDLSEAFKLDADAFEAKYSFPRPGPSTQIVTHCLKGGRAAKGMEAIKAAGHEKTAVYSGSLTDWKVKGGSVQSD